MCTMQYPARAVVNLAAVRANVANLRGRTDAAVMAVVKADGYGHGGLAVAQAALEAGATWLGIAQLQEALAVRPMLPDVRMLCWLWSPSADVRPAVRAGIDLAVTAPWVVDHVADAAADVGVRARVHLKVDTGMARGGVRPEAWEDFVRQALRRPELEIAGIWSHLARADEVEEPTTARQLDLFTDALAAAARLGVHPEVRHLAASAGVLWHPATHFDLVRPGVSVYGMVPDGSDPAPLGLVPAMRLEAELVNVKRVPAGTPVSYGHTAVVGPTTVGVVPLGYADGIPRQASNRAFVTVNGRRADVVGRICMDQFLVDLGPESDAVPGDRVRLWGPLPGDAGERPTAESWARAADTINYTITTQVGTRVPRVHVEETWS